MCNLSESVLTTGYLKGLQQGILSTAEAYRETGMPDSEIKSRIMEQFALPADAAEDCLSPDSCGEAPSLPLKAQGGMMQLVDALAAKPSTPEEKLRYLSERYQIPASPQLVQTLSEMAALRAEIEKKGIAQGLLQGLFHTVKAYRVMGLPDSEIRKRIMEKYFLTEQEAEAFFRSLSAGSISIGQEELFGEDCTDGFAVNFRKGFEEGQELEKKATARRLRKMGMPLELIAQSVERGEETVLKWLSEEETTG